MALLLQLNIFLNLSLEGLLVPGSLFSISIENFVKIKYYNYFEHTLMPN